MTSPYWADERLLSLPTRRSSGFRKAPVTSYFGRSVAVGDVNGDGKVFISVQPGGRCEETQERSYF